MWQKGRTDPAGSRVPYAWASRAKNSLGRSSVIEDSEVHSRRIIVFSVCSALHQNVKRGMNRLFWGCIWQDRGGPPVVEKAFERRTMARAKKQPRRSETLDFSAASSSSVDFSCRRCSAAETAF